LAIVWLLEWDGITPEQYDALREAIGWETDVPDGLHSHAAAFNDKGLVLVEVWESADHVQPYMDGRFLPAVGTLGIRSMPRVDLYPAHRVFLPGTSQANERGDQ